MFCSMRNTSGNPWVLICVFGVATYGERLVVIPAVLAAVLAIATFRGTEDLTDHGYEGAGRAAHQAILGAVLATALVGVGVTATAGEEPLAGFFTIAAMFAWRAFARPQPRRVAALAVFIYLAWLPFAVLDIVWVHLASCPMLDGPCVELEPGIAGQLALWALLGAGGVACWLVTRATPLAIARARLR